MVQQVTTKVPPLFDGRQSWFAYEEAVDDWCDITELDPDKRGPALRNRLTDDALVYKPLLDRDLLRDPATGVKYFKDQMRPHFVKGSISVSVEILSVVQGPQRPTRSFEMDRTNVGHEEKDPRCMDGPLQVFRRKYSSVPSVLRRKSRRSGRRGSTESVRSIR